jgi:hypothetical protein
VLPKSLRGWRVGGRGGIVWVLSRWMDGEYR